jgi:hypothetical protein
VVATATHVGRLACARTVPPANEADMRTAVVEILRRLADEASADEAAPLRRAAGSVARFGGRVVFDIAKGEIRGAGGDLAT